MEAEDPSRPSEDRNLTRVVGILRRNHDLKPKFFRSSVCCPCISDCSARSGPRDEDTLVSIRSLHRFRNAPACFSKKCYVNRVNRSLGVIRDEDFRASDDLRSDQRLDLQQVNHRLRPVRDFRTDDRQVWIEVGGVEDTGKNVHNPVVIAGDWFSAEREDGPSHVDRLPSVRSDGLDLFGNTRLSCNPLEVSQWRPGLMNDCLLVERNTRVAVDELWAEIVQVPRWKKRCWRLSPILAMSCVEVQFRGHEVTLEICPATRTEPAEIERRRKRFTKPVPVGPASDL